MPNELKKTQADPPDRLFPVLYLVWSTFCYASWLVALTLRGVFPDLAVERWIWALLFVGCIGGIAILIPIVFREYLDLLRGPGPMVTDGGGEAKAAKPLTTEEGKRLLALPDWARDRAWTLILGRLSSDHHTELMIDIAEALVAERTNADSNTTRRSHDG